MLNYLIFEENGKYNITVELNEDSFVYLKKDCSLLDIIEWKENIYGYANEFIVEQLSK